jgi:hypothetical protein
MSGPIDFLKRLYRQRSRSDDPILGTGYGLAARAHENPAAVRAQQHVLQKYGIPEKEFDLLFASYSMSLTADGSVRDWNRDIERLARLAGIPDERVLRAREDLAEAIIQRIELRLVMQFDGVASQAVDPGLVKEKEALDRLPAEIHGFKQGSIRSYGDPKLGLSIGYHSVIEHVTVTIYFFRGSLTGVPKPNDLLSAWDAERCGLEASFDHALDLLQAGEVDSHNGDTTPLIFSVFSTGTDSDRTAVALGLCYHLFVKVRPTWKSEETNFDFVSFLTRLAAVLP